MVEGLSCFKLFGETVTRSVPLFSVPKLEVAAFGFSMSSWWVQVRRAGWRDIFTAVF